MLGRTQFGDTDCSRRGCPVGTCALIHLVHWFKTRMTQLTGTLLELSNMGLDRQLGNSQTSFSHVMPENVSRTPTGGPHDEEHDCLVE